MWCLQKLLSIPWVEEVSNNDVLRQIGQDYEIMITTKIRKLEYLGHIMRVEKYSLFRLIMEVNKKGKKNFGKHMITLHRNLK